MLLSIARQSELASMSGIEETTTRDFWPHVVLDIITVSLLTNLYRKELVI